MNKKALILILLAGMVIWLVAGFDVQEILKSLLGWHIQHWLWRHGGP